MVDLAIEKKKRFTAGRSKRNFLYNSNLKTTSTRSKVIKARYVRRV